MNIYTREYNINELIDKIKLYNDNQEELDLINKAYIFAKECHGDRKRLSGELYINHSIRVAIILTSLEADYITIVATLLHECVSTEKINIIEVEKEFGKNISELVNGVSTISGLNFSASNEAMAQSQRKIFVGLANDVRVVIIKIADRLDNMRTLEFLPIENQKQKAKETLEVLIPIAHRLGLNKIKSELEELSLKYSKPEAYNDVIEKLANSKEDRDKAVLQMKNELIEILDETKIPYEIKGRSKSIYSIFKKLDKGRPFNDIYDLLALRILIDKEQDCYFLLGLIHAKYKYIPKRFKDFIAMPKNNMYQSLHTTIFGNDGNIFEIQIRTHEMDEIAERGIASHWSYKEKDKKNKALNQMEQKLKMFRTIIESDDIEEELIENAKEELENDNIYVYTPNGDVMELPSGSTPVDFAFKVHSELGESIIGAIVNSNIVPLSYELQSGDIIKINTSKTPTGPKIEWLNFVRTSQAKNKIKSYFTKNEKENFIAKGETLLQKELRKRKIEFSILEDKKNLSNLLNELKFKDITELYCALGAGRVTPIFVLNFLLNGNDTKENLILKKVMNAESKEIIIKNDIIVEGIDDIKVNLAKCCMPVFGDDIKGYITKGNGIVVHLATCPNMPSNDRTIDVRWNNIPNKKYKSILLIESDKIDNALINIINKASICDINIESVNTHVKQNFVIYEITILTLNTNDLEKYIANIYSLDYINRVERIIK